MSQFAPLAWLAACLAATIGCSYYGIRAVRLTWKVDRVLGFYTALVFTLSALGAALDAAVAWRAL